MALTQSDLDQEIETELPSNNTGAIQAIDLRGVLHDLNAAVFQPGGGGSAGAPEGSVQFNLTGAFGGDANFVWAPATGLTVGGAKSLFLSGSANFVASTNSAPVDGDVWFDGSDLRMRIGGVDYLFTMAPAPLPPSVTSISPTSGSSTGGTAVTITGSHFTGATGATIGGAAVTGLVIVNDTTITCMTPAGTAGLQSVTVTTPVGTGTGASLFTYVVLVTWGAHGPNITLSNGNLDAEPLSGAWSNVRGSTGKATGKWYFEIMVVTTPSGGSSSGQTFGGVSDATTPAGAGLDVLNVPNSWLTRDDAFISTAGTFVTTSGMAGLGTLVPGNVIGVAVDVDNKKLWLAKGNVWISVAAGAGNPAAGTNAAATWTAAMTIYLSTQLFGTGSKVRLVTVGATYAPPAGFSVWT